ncbi:GGDEF domain-containing protein [Vibrio sp. Of7-15]|uniref:GGDEF domain-containing protein n=1 Tax=Vibrio sp. Of7-15 TaxID=2724879 RepID=UPI001EF1D79B|nr:GGDEF domain-containing protein [Vibrio sp. Of7-15]
MDTWIKQLDFMDNFLEDTLTQVSYMLLAYGVTQIIKQHEQASYTDELTGLYNRKYLNKIRMSVFELVYFDLNNLKTTNDTLGHQHGDTLIMNFAHLLKQHLKNKEVAIRVGGDEFVAIVHKGNGEGLVEALKQDTQRGSICFSYGMSQGHVNDLDHIIAMADEKMYEMKKECIK